jgi:hypothetical protein
MSPNVLLPTLTALLALAFAALIALRFARRRQPYYLIWSLGLLWYALADASEAFGGAFGWNPSIYRLWYLTGAIGVAAFLGAGTLYLHRDPPFGSLTVICVLGAGVPALATDHLLIGFLGLGSAIVLGAVLTLKPQRFAEAATAILVAASVAAAIAILNAPVDSSLLPTAPDQIVSGQAFNAETRALTPPFNIAGALVLILGAALSALYALSTRQLSNRVKANVLIAVGAFIPSVASGLTRFGVTSLFFVGELLGLSCIMAGFLLSTRPSAPPRQTEPERLLDPSAVS